MNADSSSIADLWNGLLAWLQDNPTSVPAVNIGLACAVPVAILSTVIVMVVRALRGKQLNAKASIGFGLVQGGVAFATITGVYEFFHLRLSMPEAEAGLLAGFIEACTWSAVGWIYAYGKGTDRDGNPNVGFGPAGGFFWVTVVGGGLLAILGSESSSVAVGRSVIVILGAYMWYLRLLQVTTQPDKKQSRWRWTPIRLFEAIGAMEPVPDDEEEETDASREWRVRRLARAIRWRNSVWPWSWLGKRALVKQAETTKEEDVIAAARRRYAVAHLLVSTVQPKSAVMQRIIAALEAESSLDGPTDDAPEVASVSHDDASGDAPPVASVTRQADPVVSHVVAPAVATPDALVSRQPEPPVSHPVASVVAPDDASLTRHVPHDKAPIDATPVRPRRRSGQKLTAAERVTAAVTYAHEEGVPARQAALKFNANERTVQRRLSKVNGNVPEFVDSST